MSGGDGNDYLDGGSGVDKMFGGDGNDLYIVDDYRDQVKEYFGRGYDTIRSAENYTLPDNVEALDLSFGSARKGFGNSLSNVIKGNNSKNDLYGFAGRDELHGYNGNDLIDGGMGSDTMYGGQGNDVYKVDYFGDQVIEKNGEGHDTVISTAKEGYTLTDHVEDLQLRLGLVGRGNDLANEITGNRSDNQLFGYDGDDTLLGADGKDILRGGDGADILVGGQGDDTLYGEGDNDKLYGNEGRDLLVGYGGVSTEVDLLVGLQDADTFALGNKDMMFYSGSGYANIADFDRTEGDKILVHGPINDYVLVTGSMVGTSALDTLILDNGGDVIGVVQDNLNVSANDLITAI